MSREEFIKAAIDNGITDKNKLNQGLKQFGYEQLSKTEALEVQDNTFGQNFLQRAASNLVRYGKGLGTLYGQAEQYIQNPEARAAINEQAKDYLSKPGRIPLDLANAVLSTYNDLDVNKLVTQSPKETLSDIGAGISARPIDAGLDLLGASGVGVKGYKAIARTFPNNPLVKKINSTANKVTLARRREMNSILNASKNIKAEDIEKLQIKLNNLGGTPDDLALAYKNLETGSAKKAWEGTPAQIEFTNKVKDFSKEVDAQMVKLGLDPKRTRSTATQQYIQRALGDNYRIDDVNKLMSDPAYAKQLSISEDTIKTLKAEAEEAFDKGFIFPLHHEGTGVGINNLAGRGVGLNKERVYGNQSYKELAENFEAGYNKLLNQIETSGKSLNALETAAQEVAKKVDSLDNIKLAKNEILVSPTKLREDIQDVLSNGGDIETRIKNLSKGLTEPEKAHYANDLYIFNKSDIQALERAYTGAPKELTQKLGALGVTSALGTFRYVAGNRLANSAGNIIAGVTPLDYIKSVTVYKNLIPEGLKRTTTYAGYLEKELPANAKLSDIYKRIFKDVKKGNVLEKAQAVNLGSTVPIFYIDKYYELWDRASNYVKQAEKLAKETNRTTEAVLKEAKSGNNKTFRRLMENVNNDLGDYAGKNYYFSNRINNGVRLAIPFVKPYTQGARQLVMGAINHPIQQQVFARIPGRYGYNVSQRAQEIGVNPNEQYGGYPILKAQGKLPSRVVYSQYHPYIAPTEVVSDPEKVFGGNPMMGGLALPIFGYNRYGKTPTLPNAQTINGTTYILDNNGNVIGKRKAGELPFGDKLKLAASSLANTYVAPINQVNSIALPIIAGITNQRYRRPSDFSLFGQIGENVIPFLSEGRQQSKGYVGPENLVRQLGFNIEDTYPKRNERITLKERKRVRKQLNKVKNRIER